MYMYNMFVYLYICVCVYIYSVYMYIYILKAGETRQRRGDKMGKRQEEGLPWCFGLAEGCFDRSCAGGKPAARGRKQNGS